MSTPEFVLSSILGYMPSLLLALAIFHEDYIDDKITKFESFVLAIFWPISLPYKLIKTFIKAIIKI